MKKGFFQFVGEGKNQGHLLRSIPGNDLDEKSLSNTFL